MRVCPHAFNFLADVEQDWLSRLGLAEFSRALLDDVAARVALLVDCVAESVDQLLPRQHGLDARLGLVRAVESLDELHGRLVCAAVQRAAQSSDGCRNGAVDVALRGGGDAAGEGGGGETVLGVEDQRGVDGAHVHFLGLAAVVAQQAHEVASDGVRRAVDLATALRRVDALAEISKVVPVEQHRSERTDELIKDVALLAVIRRGVRLGIHRAQQSNGGEHDVHRVSVLGHQLQSTAKSGGQH